MENKKYTVIEVVADYIYFVITGNLNTLNKFINKLDSNKKYMPVRIDIPLAYAGEEIEKEYNIKIIIEEGTESAQSFAFARHSFIHNKTNSNDDIFTNSTYMLIELELDTDNNNYKLKFPKLELQDDDDPEEVLLKWAKSSYNLDSYNSKFIANMKKTIKPITLVGYNEDILVYTAKI